MTWLSRHRLLSLLIVLAVPGLATAMMALPEEDEKKISISKLPKSIQKALTGVDVDNIELTTVYEIGIEEDGVEIEFFSHLFPINRISRTRQRRRSERHYIHPFPQFRKTLCIPGKHLNIGHEVMSE